MYKQATREGVRFHTTKGMLSVEQLWSLSTSELNDLAVSLDAQYNESGKKSFLTTRSVKDKSVKLKFDIAYDILTTKLEEAAEASSAREVKEHNQKILALIAEKQEDELKGKSVKDLEKMLKK